MEERIIKALREIDVDQAEQLWKGSTNRKAIADAIVFWDFDTESLVPYTFAQHLIAKNQENMTFLIEGHDLALELMLSPLCHIEGAYFCALYHNRELIRLTNHEDLGYLEYLLFLNEVSDHVVSDEEAEKRAAIY